MPSFEHTTSEVSLKTNTLAALACTIWATAFVCVKITLEYMPPLSVAGIRFVLAGVLLLPLCKGIAGLKKLWSQQSNLIYKVSFYQTILLYGSFFLAMPYVRGAQAAIIIGSSPLTSAVAAFSSLQCSAAAAPKSPRLQQLSNSPAL